MGAAQASHGLSALLNGCVQQGPASPNVHAPSFHAYVVQPGLEERVSGGGGGQRGSVKAVGREGAR